MTDYRFKQITGNRGLPIIYWPDEEHYGVFAVRQYDDGRLEAITEVPARSAWATSLLDSDDVDRIEWDGHRIRLTLDNGSWVWIAEAQNHDGSVIYARWPD